MRLFDSLAPRLANRLIRILEYHSRDDAEQAIKVLDNKELRGNVVRAALAGEAGSKVELSSSDESLSNDMLA